MSHLGLWSMKSGGWGVQVPSPDSNVNEATQPTIQAVVPKGHSLVDAAKLYLLLSAVPAGHQNQKLAYISAGPRTMSFKLAI